MESRLLLDAVVAHWIGGSGNWSDPTNWDIGAVPNDGGGNTYKAIIDLTESDPVVDVDQTITISGLLTSETIRVDSGGILTSSGAVANTGDLIAVGGTLKFDAATVDNAGHTITADGGIVEVENSTINGGVLRVTDNASSFVEFSGDVTLNGVPWEDPGAGEFRVYGTVARLLGDYAVSLPAGYTLVVAAGLNGFAGPGPGAAQLDLMGGVFENDGTIELRGGYGVDVYGSTWPNWATLNLGSSTTLNGSGQIVMSATGSYQDSAQITGVAGTVLTVGGSQSIHGFGQITTNVINHGLMEANVASRSLVLSGPIENNGTIRKATGANLTLSNGLSNTGIVEITGVGTLSLSGPISTGTDLTAEDGATVRFSNATVLNAGHTITADGGIVEVKDSTINGGVLRVTDNASSFVEFSGDVTLNGVPWEDPGAGEFRIYRTTARLLGDYTNYLPAGYTLVVDSGWHAYSSGPGAGPAQLTLEGGMFTNAGTIVLRGGYWMDVYGTTYPVWAGLFLEDSTALSGSGQIVMSATGSYQDSAQITGVAGSTLTVGQGQSIEGLGQITTDVINHGLIEANVASRSLVLGGLVESDGTIRKATGANLTLSNGLGNTGIVEITGAGTLSLNGPISTGTDLQATMGGVLNLDNAMVTNVGHTITADGGIVEVENSTINGGVLRATDNASSFVQFNGDVTLNGVPWEDPGAGEFRVYGTVARLLGDYAVGLPVGYTLVVAAGLNGFAGPGPGAAQLDLMGGVFENDGTIELRGGYGVDIYGSTWANWATLNLGSSTTLNGSGQIVMSATGSYHDSAQITGAAGSTLTVGPGQSIEGLGQITVPVVNQGSFTANQSGRTLTLSSGLTNSGTAKAVNGGTLNIDGPLVVSGQGVLMGQASGTIAVADTVLGDTRNADQYSPQVKVLLNGSGTEGSPQLVEVMGRDLGAVSEGFSKNFAYGTVTLSNNAYVKLVDQSDNAAGVGAEAIYANSLFVPAGATLDLNGLHLYTRAVQIAGAVIGGTITQIPDSGPIIVGNATPGAISVAGELDEWTFFGRAGRSVTVVVNAGSGGSPAPLAPYLGYAQVQLLDAADNVLATATSESDGQIVELTDVVLPADGTYRIQVQATAEHMSNTGNYLVTVWDVTADVNAIVVNQQRTGSIETPYSVDRWTFSALAGQQVRLDLINTSGTGIVFDLNGPEGWTGFSDIPEDSDLITLPSSGTYTLTAHGTGGEYGGPYAVCLQETTQTALPLGTTYNGTFVGSGQAQLFRVDVPESMPMKITLDDSSTANRNELYVKFGTPPTRGDFDYRYSSLSAADQQILVPMATAGTWYVLVYGDSIPTASDYALTATMSGLIVKEVTPDRHGNAADAALTLKGAGFDSTTVVELVAADGARFEANQLTIDSFIQLTATFAANMVPSGTYSIRVSQPDGDSDQLTNAFQIIGGGQPHLETNLIVPSILGRNSTATLYVEYANTGDVSMPAPLLVLASGDPDGSDHPLMTLDQSLVSQGFWTSAIPEGFSETIQILASGETPGILQPGESVKVPVYFVGLLEPWGFSDTQVEFNLGVLTADNTSAVDWNSLKDSMRPPTINTEAWEPIWANFVSQTGETWGDYLAMLDDNAAYLGRLGERVVDVGQLLSFEFQQADGLNPVRTLASAVDAVVEAPGLPITFSRFFAEPISQRYEQGPFGYGWSHNWEYSLITQADGTVEINGPGSSIRTFQPDSRQAGSYFAQACDYGALTAVGGGVFTLRESDGFLYAFRSDGKLDYVEDTNGNRVTAGYTSDQLTTLTHSSGQTLQITYNAAGLIESVTDQIGRQTTFTYDAANDHLISVQDYEGKVTAYSYITGQGAPSEHGLASVEYPGGIHQYFTYDAQGRLASIYRDGNAEAVSFSYNSAGTVMATNALGDSSEFYFDYRGLLVKTEDALDNAVYLSFDNAYNLTALTDPTGRSYTYSYDAEGNLTRSTDPLGNTTSFTHTGAFNRLASVTDANGNKTIYTYDTDGNLTAIIYADGTRETWTYDSSGNPTAWTNRRGNATPGDPDDHVIAFTYDSDGRITGKTYADGSQVEYHYDARGNLDYVVDSTGTTDFTYNAKDELTRIDYPNGQWLEFTYNAAGQRASSLDQLGHRLEYYYDTVGRLDYMLDETGQKIVDYDYDAAGRLEKKTLGNGVYTTYEYDAAGQLLHLINYKPDDSVLSRFDYSYDSRGRRISMATLDGQWTYEYDDIGQLTHAVLDSTNPEIPDQELTYVYDALGNRISTIENGVTTNYTTNSMNQYTQVGDTTYVFDADGSLIKEVSPTGTTTYVYNDENRLASITQTVGTQTDIWQYTYDALGNRVATTENGTTTRHVIDPIGLGNVVGEYSASGDLIATYDYGFGLISRTAGTSVAYYTFDAIGSTSEMTIAGGTVVNSYHYDPFAISLQKHETISNQFQYAGEIGVRKDNNGLVFMRARYYDSNLSRFTTEDPLLLPGIDKYSYANNDPVSFIDPSGLLSLRDIMRFLRDAFLGFFDLADFLSRPMTTVADLYEDGTISSDDLRNAGSVLGNGYKGMGMSNPEVQDLLRREGGSQTSPQEPQRPPRSTGELPGNRGNLPGEYDPPTLPEPPAPNGPSNSGSGALPTSFDPNEKTGPAGFNDSGFINADSVFSYCIDFENESLATAPAQQVVITDQLDSDLDWNTFEITEIGFGDLLIAIPDNSQHYETAVPMTYNGVDFEVQIEVGINLLTGQIYATFYSIDPDTGLPPDVLTGFLPPEDGTGRGMGYFSYTIDPKEGLPTGTEIRNIALISFDGQLQIATNQVDPHDPSQGIDPTKEAFNSIDAGIPTSNVLSLPAMVALTEIPVQWSGEDDVGGSGIANYDIYVSTDGGSFTLWMNDTAETSAVYPGQAGHSYAFYSIAKDHVGHVEALPGTPDAEISVMPVYDNRQMDVAVWRPGDGFWYVINSEDGSITSTQWGAGYDPYNDVPVPGDYDGDGITDLAVWRPGDGFWYIINSEDGSITSTQWGAGYLDDKPVPADYDGDGKTDIAVWRPGDGFWYVINSEDGSITSTQWGAGALEDVPVPGDYDGDGKTDYAVLRPGEYAYWYILKSSDGGVIAEQWGSSTLEDEPVPGDYDGDGRTDIAVWRPGDGFWYVINSEDGSITSTQWGAGYLDDKPMPGDYDGDGVTDIAVWRPGDGYWYIISSEDGSIKSQQWGWGIDPINDVPVATASAPASGMGGGLLMMALVASPADSTASLNTDSALTFTQVANFSGVDAFTPAAESHGLWPWMNAPMFGRDVAPLGREVGCHGLYPWGSTYKSNDGALDSESSKVDFRIRKIGVRESDFVFDGFGRDRINRRSHSHARSDHSTHDVDGLPVTSSLIDVSVKYDDFITPRNGKAAIRLSASWVSDFVNGLATRDYDNPNSNIQVVLVPGNDTKDRSLNRKA